MISIFPHVRRPVPASVYPAPRVSYSSQGGPLSPSRRRCRAGIPPPADPLIHGQISRRRGVQRLPPSVPAREGLWRLLQPDPAGLPSHCDMCAAPVVHLLVKPLLVQNMLTATRAHMTQRRKELRKESLPEDSIRVSWTLGQVRQGSSNAS